MRVIGTFLLSGVALPAFAFQAPCTGLSGLPASSRAKRAPLHALPDIAQDALVNTVTHFNAFHGFQVDTVAEEIVKLGDSLGYAIGFPEPVDVVSHFAADQLVKQSPATLESLGVLATFLLITAIQLYARLYWCMRSPFPSYEAVKKDMTKAIPEDDLKLHLSLGDQVQACYDLFISDTTSEYFGDCILVHQHDGPGFTPEQAKAMRDEEDRDLEDYIKSINGVPSDTKLVKTIFSTSKGLVGGAKEPTFMGFITFSKSRRDLTIVFRGTVTPAEAQEDAKFGMKLWHKQKEKEVFLMSIVRWLFTAWLEPDHVEYNGRMVQNIPMHRGFLGLYTRGEADRPGSGLKTGLGEFLGAVTDDLIKGAKELEDSETSPQRDLREAMEKYKDKIDTVTVTGHSLGSSLATLAALDAAQVIKENNWTTKTTGDLIKTRGAVYCNPLVGGRNLENALDELDVTLINYIERGDIVPLGPPSIWFPSYKRLSNTYRLDPLRVFFGQKQSLVNQIIHLQILGFFEPFKYVIGLVNPDALKRRQGYLLKEYKLDDFWKPWLSDLKDVGSFAGDWHNLQVVMYCLAATRGLHRDLDLINKSSGLVNENKRHVPENWFTPLKHKGVAWNVSGDPPKLFTELDHTDAADIRVPKIVDSHGHDH